MSTKSSSKHWHPIGKDAFTTSNYMQATTQSQAPKRMVQTRTKTHENQNHSLVWVLVHKTCSRTEPCWSYSLLSTMGSTTDPSAAIGGTSTGSHHILDVLLFLGKPPVPWFHSIFRPCLNA